MSKMNDELLPKVVTDECSRFGEPKLVYRTGRKTIVGGFLMAALPCAFGAAVLMFLVSLRGADWTKDILGTVVLLVVAAAAFFCGWILVRKTNRLRRVLVVVHDGGLVYRDGVDYMICSWDQIEDVQWRVDDHYQESSLYLSGVAKIPGTTTREFSHTTHKFTVRRNDGVQLVFTDELENVVELARVIVECINIRRGRPLGSG
jgi:hypothetical protein